MLIETLRDFSDAGQCRTLVLKIGSSLLVDGNGAVRRRWLAGLADEIADLRTSGQRVLLVSSGAIALGAARLGRARGDMANLADAQAAASVGQIALAGLYSDLLAERAMIAAQILLTLSDLEDRRRYLNASATLRRLLDMGTVPVINENDSVATEEIRFGDNDRLAARVAQAAGADGVVLLSDVDGLMDRDPRDTNAQLVSSVRGVSEDLLGVAGGAEAGGIGTGGMASKLQAAQIAERAGIALAIVNGTRDRPLETAMRRDCGTVFLPVRRDDARKGWIGGRKESRGTLTVDAGCAAALHEGASVLAAGIVAAEGSFERADLVTIVAQDGRALAQGLIEYDARSCHAIMGRSHVRQQEILGHAPRSAVVHRDQLVIL